MSMLVSEKMLIFMNLRKIPQKGLQIRRPGKLDAKFAQSFNDPGFSGVAVQHLADLV